MMKPTIIMGFVLVSVLAFAVYQVEHRVENLRSELKEINSQLRTDRESIHVLRAEWSYLNQPSRLKVMADTHLALDYISAEQVGGIGVIPMRAIHVSSHVQH